jgi:hypothetical protein
VGAIDTQAPETSLVGIARTHTATAHLQDSRHGVIILEWSERVLCAVEHQARFRRIWTVTTVIWGVALLIDAAVRVAMAYTLPIDAIPGLSGALWIVTLLALQTVTNIYFLRSGLWTVLLAETGPTSLT